MIGLEPLYDLIELSLWSAYVKARKPLSIIVLAPHSHGKSEILCQHSSEPDGIIIVNSGTRYGFYTVLNNWGYKLKHIIIPDLSSILNAHPQVAPDLIEFLSQMTEEGITRINTYHFRTAFNPPMKVGLLTAVTASEFWKKQKRIRQHSFRSRFIPFSYRMDDSIRDKVLDYQRGGGFMQEDRITFNFPYIKDPHDRKDIYCSPEIVKELQHMIEDPFLIRGVEHLRILLQSSALSRGKKDVGPEDVMKIMEIAPYMNLKMPYLGDPYRPLPQPPKKKPVGRPRKNPERIEDTPKERELPE